MEITAVDEAALKAIDWNKVINMPAYKLYIEVMNATVLVNHCTNLFIATTLCM